ncbi:MAG: Rnf-Nqr domain containing protein [bacterium]
MNNDSRNNILLITLGITPLLALTDSAINIFTIGLVILIVFVISSIVVNFLRKYFIKSSPLILLIIITATITTIIDQFMQIHKPVIRSEIDIFLPLTAINSFIFHHINRHNNSDKILASTFNGIKKWLGIFVLLLIISIFRELMGKGTLFNQPFLTSQSGLNLLILVSAPPGAFIITAIVLAIFFSLKKGENGQ